MARISSLRRQRSSHGGSSSGSGVLPGRPSPIVVTTLLACILLVVFYMTIILQDPGGAESFYHPSTDDDNDNNNNNNGNDEPNQSSSRTIPSLSSSQSATVVDVVKKERDFLEIALETNTDKVQGVQNLPFCSIKGQKKEGGRCAGIDDENKFCRPFGHFYHTMYQKWLGRYSLLPDDDDDDETEKFQLLEIGYSNGNGFEAFQQFLPQAEAHSMEITCMDGKRDRNSKIKSYREKDRLHCGDASDVNFLNTIWTTKLNRGGSGGGGGGGNNNNNNDKIMSSSSSSPPLKVVIDDGSHVAAHMVQSVFFWFPRIAPRGIMVVEDIQPTPVANKFRTQFLPQIMSDLHYCGGSNLPDHVCFPTLQPLLASIHCEMHICVLERNDEPAVENLSLADSKSPPNALDLTKCKALTQ